MDTHETVADMLQDVPEADLSALEEWYLKASRQRLQLAACCGMSLLTAWAALRLPASVVQRTPVTIGTLLMAGFATGHAVYFIVYTALFCRRISLLPNLRLTWSSPIDTPGLVSLSRASQFEARLGMLLFLAVAPPLVYAYIKVSGVPERLLYLGLMLLPLLCILVIGLIIQGWLAVPARRSKEGTLHELSDSINALRGGRAIGQLDPQELSALKDRLEFYQLMSGISESFFKGNVISQYLASVGAAAIPFIVAFILR